MSDVETTLPAGWYAAPDPDQPLVMTYWRVHGGRLSGYPQGQRWAPIPPAWSNLRGAERTAARDDWYRDVYFGWKHKVIAAIESDPVAAAERFAGQYPAPEWTPRRRVRQREPRGLLPPTEARSRRTTQALLAEILHDAGCSSDDIAATLGVSEPTARRRVALAATLPISLTAAERRLLARLTAVLQQTAVVRGNAEAAQFLNEVATAIGPR